MTTLYILRNILLIIVFILLFGCSLKDHQHEVYNDSQFEILGFIDPDCIKQEKLSNECYRYREKRM